MVDLTELTTDKEWYKNTDNLEAFWDNVNGIAKTSLKSIITPAVDTPVIEEVPK